MLKHGLKPSVLLAALLMTAAAWAGEAAWIDVRSAGEFDAGHVEGAVNIPHTEIVDRISEVTEDKAATLYLYCRSGRRSGIAADALAEAGFSNAINIGGLEDAMKKAASHPTP